MWKKKYIVGTLLVFFFKYLLSYMDMWAAKLIYVITGKEPQSDSIIYLFLKN